ncbi:putative leucine-rich repeat-containing protein DDB_G0281931 [Dendronephthya gigantea]|uniref:putative leucine-rich repeat-containing protein DDB_G0281931 n=1 Tax=Dendronephthya gigantea TaxID=151771 RepID=UPI001068D8F2|nr:putative leucine-rich repeat-containing protein DDB_G0281931 [Dendronephthya gigantea]
MVKFSTALFIVNLLLICGFALPQLGDRLGLGISHFSYLTKAGDADADCLHNFTANNTVTDFTNTPDQERSFLLELFHATGGSWSWGNKKGWSENSTVHHCDWFGVECYNNSAYVKTIALIANRLYGRPPNFWRFRNLQGLCLSRNIRMTGQMGEIISSNMTRLRRLAVSYSGMHGGARWDILSQLLDLEMLQICCMVTSLNGFALPHNIGRLNKLQVLSIGENSDFKAVDLPRSIRNLTKLWFLDLEYAKLLSGNLSYFNNMTRLQYLHLTNCGLKGTLPHDFGLTHPDIIELHLHGNNLVGELRSCFLGFKKITELILGKNHLQGLLPTALGKLETLNVLDLSNNNFTGFAENMTFNKQLQTLFIYQNFNLSVEGEKLLQALQLCKDNLRMLLAKECGLKSSLSGSLLWSFQKIMYIDLSQNNLTGQVPKSDLVFYSIPYLFYLNLASNNFTGGLPKSFFSPLKTLIYLDIRGNRYMRSTTTIPSNTYLGFTLTERLKMTTYSCPTFKITSTAGRVDMDPAYYSYSYCFYNSGYYGFRRYCKPCMKGASCQQPPVDVPTQQMIVKMTIQKGYWPCCGNYTNVTRMVKCSEDESFTDEACSPSGKCECEVQLVNGRPQTSCNTSCICRYGNKGRFCSQCKHGYFKKGSLCVSCLEFRKNFPVVTTVSFVLCLIGSIVLLVCFRRGKRFALVLMFLLALTLIVLHIKYIIPNWFFVIIFAVWILGLSGASENLEGFLCIAVFFFQSLDAMFADANVWPQTIVLLKYQITNAFNFELTELTCSFSDAERPEIGILIILLLPAAAIFLIWFLHGLGKAICSQNRNIPSTFCKRLSIQILLFVYFPITAKTLQAVSPCEHRDGLSYLKATPWLDCDGTSYNWLVTLGYVSLVLFVIGVPLFVFLPLLYKFMDNNGEAVSEDTDKWLKPLYTEFKTRYRRFFPLVFLARRLLLAVFLTVVPTRSAYQVIGITLLLIVFIVIILVFRPYQQYFDRFEFETMADVVVSIVLLLSFVGLALLRVSPKFNNSLVWLIVSMNCVVVLCCIVVMLVLFVVNLWKSTRNAQAGDAQLQYEQIPGE